MNTEEGLQRLCEAQRAELKQLAEANAVLLAACEKMLAKFDSIRPDDAEESPMCRDARAAIAKAKVA